MMNPTVRLCQIHVNLYVAKHIPIECGCGPGVSNEWLFTSDMTNSCVMTNSLSFCRKLVDGCSSFCSCRRVDMVSWEIVCNAFVGICCKEFHSNCYATMVEQCMTHVHGALWLIQSQNYQYSSVLIHSDISWLFLWILLISLWLLLSAGFSQEPERKEGEECFKTGISSCGDCISSGQFCVWCKQPVRVLCYTILLCDVH